MKQKITATVIIRSASVSIEVDKSMSDEQKRDLIYAAAGTNAREGIIHECSFENLID